VSSNTGYTPWTLTMPAGSVQEWQFTFTVPATSALYNITSIAGWEWVVRANPGDTGTPLISITTTPSAPGSLTVNNALSQVLLTVNPAATAGMAAGQYAQALWSSPSTSSAFCWLAGALILQAAPQP
jgi:hypothetical protein